MSKTAFMFPGQGSQCVGMGADFYEACPKARAVYDMASELIGIDMKRLCFEENEHLDQTEFTQIALLTTGMAMEQSIRACGLTPDVTAGLSLGEYNAIVSAGGMEMADAMKVVRRRGILMEEAVPAGEGAMAAVLGMEDAKIEEILSGISGAYIANYNCPGQIVITGYEAAVAAASEKLKEAGRKAGTSAERKRPVPFPDDGSCVPGADRSARGRRLYGVEDSVCDECNRPVCA